MRTDSSFAAVIFLLLLNFIVTTLFSSIILSNIKQTPNQQPKSNNS